MKLRKFAAGLLCAAVLAGCGSSGSSDSNQGTDAPEAKALKIGIVQLAEHPALDEATRGFEEYVKENLPDGFTADFDYKNAQGDQINCQTIAQTFVNDKDDLIYAVATPAAQAAAQETKDIPIVVSAVTDLKSAGLVEDNEKPGTNVTGASDLNPVADQIDLLVQLVPDAKTIGILYCNAESNSEFQADIAKKEIEERGLKAEIATATDSNQIQQVVESLNGKVDALYIPTDNLMAENMPAISQVATSMNLPVVCGEENMVNNGGLATFGVNYYELGKMAGEQAIAILCDGQKPADIAVAYMKGDDCTLVVNKKTAEAIGLDIPADILDKAVVVGEDE